MHQETRGRLMPIVAAAAVALLGLATGLAAAQTDLPGSPATAVIISDVAAGWSFALVGAVLWRTYPSSRVGALAVAVGLASFLPDIRWFETSLTWTLGSMLADIHLVLLAWLILAFPTGRLGRGGRIYVQTAFAYFFTLAVAGHLFEDPVPGCGGCPSSFMLIRPDPELNDLIWSVGQFLNLILVGVLVAMIVHKWNSSSTTARRGLGPVVWALGPIGLALVVAFIEPLIGFGEAGALAVLLIERLALVVFPIALGVGMVRSRLDRAKAADLAREVETIVEADELERLIGEALGDRSARLGFWTGGGDLIDVEGDRLEIADRAEATITSATGNRLATIFHDPAVDSDLVAAVAATASLAVRNEHLRAELRRQLAEVERSRQRIAEAGVAERRRIERDLHDGAQQGLLALGASLGSIRVRSEGEVAQLLDRSIADLREIIDDLRELARGVHPPILTERGLGPAIEALAERTPLPVKVEVTSARCNASTEAAAYFFVSEATANAVKHSQANELVVAVGLEEGVLHVLVEDDGVGGAGLVAGGGLQGLSDRLLALGGSLSVSKGDTGGSRVEGWLPCG